MIQLIYASAATKPFSADALRQLLVKARSRNTMYKVSGMLLYHNGSFLQVLEGPEESVNLILKSIERDPRHSEPRTLANSIIQTREFEGWSMGFVDTSHAISQPAGHVDFYRALPTLADSASRARKFLRFFKDGLYHEAPKSMAS